MKNYLSKDSVVEFIKRAYEKINTPYRMARFEEMLRSGKLEGMCSSKVHKRFGVRG